MQNEDLHSLRRTGEKSLIFIRTMCLKANRTPDQAGMKLRRPPVRPSWKPLYDAAGIRIASWSRFLSDAYWNVPLENAP